jgi:lipopolysaccharide biosynthesis regulator YciM
MELTLLFLLLPVAAISGWWIGHRGKDSANPLRSGSEISGDYFKGLNYLLNEQPDKAIDVFVRMLEVDSETVETHLALGNLFRRRGEVDRAIRIHQNLIARPTLTGQQRSLALLELGQDYLRAGLLGRAESLFAEVVEQEGYRAEALERLLDIYQQEKDWEKAIHTAKRMENMTGRRMNALVAQFNCELAATYQAQGDNKMALKILKRALSVDRTCVRASLLKAAIERKMGNCRAALKTLMQVETQDAAFLSEVVEPMVNCYQALGRLDEGERYLDHLLSTHGGTAPLLALAELMAQDRGEGEASKRVAQYLRQNPSVAGLNRLIELQLSLGEESQQENLRPLQELTARLLEAQPRYQCSGCGYESKKLCWQCPSCKQWSSLRPVQELSANQNVLTRP